MGVFLRGSERVAVEEDGCAGEVGFDGHFEKLGEGGRRGGDRDEVDYVVRRNGKVQWSGRRSIRECE